MLQLLSVRHHELPRDPSYPNMRFLGSIRCFSWILEAGTSQVPGPSGLPSERPMDCKHGIQLGRESLLEERRIPTMSEALLLPGDGALAGAKVPTVL